MKKIGKILIYELLFSIVYFVIFSKSLYRAGYFIHTYYPGALIIGISLIIFANKKSWKLEKAHLYGVIASFIIIIFGVPFILDCFFEGLFRDFYLRGYENLFYLMQYYNDVIK